ncbi:MAG: MOSC domain-containing protein, partial [Planctomycetota bacterium]
MSVRLARITVFPIKSLDGMTLSRAVVRLRAGLANDRRWA